MLLRARRQPTCALPACHDVFVLGPVRRSRPVLHRHQRRVDRLVSYRSDHPGIVSDGLDRLPRRVPRRFSSHHTLLPHVRALWSKFLQELLAIVVVEVLRVDDLALGAVPLGPPHDPQRHAVDLCHYPPLPLPVALLARVLLVAVAGNKLACALHRVRGLEHVMADRLVALQPAGEAAVGAAEQDVGEDVAAVRRELTRELVVEGDNLLIDHLRGPVYPYRTLGKAAGYGELQRGEVGLMAFRLAGTDVLDVGVGEGEGADLLVGGCRESLHQVGGDVTLENFSVASLVEDDEGRAHRRHHRLHSRLDSDSLELGLEVFAESSGCVLQELEHVLVEPLSTSHVDRQVRDSQDLEQQPLPLVLVLRHRKHALRVDHDCLVIHVVRHPRSCCAGSLRVGGSEDLLSVEEAVVQGVRLAVPGVAEHRDDLHEIIRPTAQEALEFLLALDHQQVLIVDQLERSYPWRFGIVTRFRAILGLVLPSERNVLESTLPARVEGLPTSVPVQYLRLELPLLPGRVVLLEVDDFVGREEAVYVRPIADYRLRVILGAQQRRHVGPAPLVKGAFLGDARREVSDLRPQQRSWRHGRRLIERL
mmetsp:Transcript_42352/g.133449  ORF Transcript_42352/g.133449 Transcript_42352/m.133449 type:complete len:591 (-) Transcript_42352:113-1885(-)